MKKRETESLFVGPDQICLVCGLSHVPARRQRALRRLLPAERDVLQEIHPCWWGGGEDGTNRLLSDLKAVGAVKETTGRGTKDNVWFPPEYVIPRAS